MSAEYRELVAKVSAFTAGVETRRASSFACAEGCSACCEAYLTVSPVEARGLREALAALPDVERQELARRGAREIARAERGEAARCALLSDEGSCAGYGARPLVCRTQGHALLYPAGLIPAESVRKRAAKGEVTHCPLNYGDAEPGTADTLDAGLVDKLLAVVNHRYALTAGVDPGERIAIAEIAREAGVLASAPKNDPGG